uniref:Uncharacterized protein n=1 Tax=Sarcophilus harrisii TaxID=9305 RepID=A0A7N4PBM8_SARHA
PPGSLLLGGREREAEKLLVLRERSGTWPGFSGPARPWPLPPGHRPVSSAGGQGAKRPESRGSIPPIGAPKCTSCPPIHPALCAGTGGGSEPGPNALEGETGQTPREGGGEVRRSRVGPCLRPRVPRPSSPRGRSCSLSVSAGPGDPGPLHLPESVPHDQGVRGQVQSGRLERPHLCSAHRLPQPRALTFSPQKASPAPSPRASSPGAQRWPDAGSPAPGGERRGSRPEGLPARLGAGGTGSPQASTPPRGHRDGPETRQSNPLRLPPRSRRCSGDSDSSASSAQSGILGCCRGEEGSPGPRKDSNSQRATRVPAALRRPPAHRSKSRDRGPGPGPRVEERGRPRGAQGGRDARPAAPSPARRARSQGREDQTMLLIHRDRDGQHSWARPGGSGRSTPRARSPALPRARAQPVAAREPPRPLQVVDTLCQELEELARTFRAPLQLDARQEQQLYRCLEEEFLANSKALEAERASLAPAPQTTPEPAAPDSAYCSSSSSSSSLNFFSKHAPPGEAPRPGPAPNGMAAVPNGSGDAWDPRTPARGRAPALSSSSDESNYCPALNDVQEVPEGGWGEAEPGGLGDERGGPGLARLPADLLRPCARPRVDNQPDRKPSRIPTPLAPRRPSADHRAWQGLPSAFPEPLTPGPRGEGRREEGAWM